MVGWFTSLTFDSDDHPCISYRKDGSGDIRYICYMGPGAKPPWVSEIVHQNGDVGEFTSLPLDSSDRPHIRYYTTEGLKYDFELVGE